jgi:DNA repair exonuclease SbcCD ATPase subunit
MILSCCGDDMSKDNEQLIRDALSDIRDSLRDLDNQVDSMDKNLVAYRVAFDHHIQQDEKMYEEFKRMNDILMENTESLKYHIRRTALLEEAMLKIDARLSPIEIERIKKQAVNAWLKQKMVTVAKIFGAATALVAALTAVWPLITSLFK